MQDRHQGAGCTLGTTHTGTLQDRHNRQHYQGITTPQGNCEKLLRKVSSAAAEDIQSESTHTVALSQGPKPNWVCGNVIIKAT